MTVIRPLWETKSLPSKPLSHPGRGRGPPRSGGRVREWSESADEAASPAALPQLGEGLFRALHIFLAVNVDDDPRSGADVRRHHHSHADRKSTRLNSSHSQISYAVFCLKKKNT